MKSLSIYLQQWPASFQIQTGETQDKQGSLWKFLFFSQMVFKTLANLFFFSHKLNFLAEFFDKNLILFQFYFNKIKLNNKVEKSSSLTCICTLIP